MNKKILVIISILLLISAGGYFALLNKDYLLSLVREEEQVEKIETEPEVSVFQDKLDPIYGNPIRLFIPEANIDADVVEVGTDSSGGLEAPSTWHELGWYRKSAKTGEGGNIIIDGHYDDNYGRPASFWNLKNMELGDKVYLVDSYGRVYAYEVNEVFFLDITDPNRLEVFKSEEGRSSLTLITCGGVWSVSKSTFDKRLVVKADRV